MNEQFIGDQTYNLAIDNGADINAAKAASENAVNDYRAGRSFGRGKPWDLIQHHVKIAAEITGKARVKINKAGPKRAYRKRKDTSDMFGNN